MSTPTKNHTDYNEGYKDGWNACRAEMMESMKKTFEQKVFQQGSKEQDGNSTFYNRMKQDRSASEDKSS